MDRLIKKGFLFLIIFSFLSSSFPKASFGYNGYDPYPNGALTKLDPDVRMTSQKQWMDHENYRSYKYKIEHPEFTYPDFMYEANWMVEVDGKRIDKKIMLMRPRSNGGLGRTFVQNADLSYWGRILNGNPDYIQREASNNNARVTNAYRPEEQYARLYIRDAAKLTGAKVNGTRDLPYFDAALLQYGEVIIETTKFPIATNGLPAKGEPNTDIKFNVSGEEFYPHSTYGTRNEINYKITLDGSLIKEGKKPASNFSEQLTINKPAGKYVVEVTVWDRVERATKVKKTIVIGNGTTPPIDPDPPVDGGEIPEVPDRYEYELDVEVSRIDGRTTEQGTNTKTDVYVKRADFSASREQAKQEFETYIQTVEGIKATAESEKAAAESAKASAESGLSSCQATPPDKDGNTPDCSSYSSAIAEASQKIAEATQKIAACEAAIQKAKAELAYIESEEAKYRTIQPTVILDFNDRKVSETTVSLTEGEEGKRYTFPGWSLSSDGTIMAQINENGPYQEFFYDPLESRSEQSLGYNTRVGHDLYSSSSSNNWKDTPIYIASHASAPCSADLFGVSSIEGIVRTINEDGNKRELKERVTSQFSVKPRDTMRAGFGFDYVITTVYENEDTEPEPTYAVGSQSAHSFFPTLVNYLPYEKKEEGYEVNMETSDSNMTHREVKNWLLPPVAVEEYSANIFSIRNNDYKYHLKRNEHDTLLLKDEKGKELRKWYVGFDQPDGDYSFSVKTYDAGVNKLNTCQTGKVAILGSIIGDPNGNDDFVKRSIVPDNPFPGGVGWNWKNRVDRLMNLTTWYRNFPYAEPEKIPSNEYSYQFYLTQEKLEEVRKFNEKMKHEFILGKSLFDSVYIPKSK